MKRRPKWSHVVVSLGVIAAVAIAAPALGISSSIKKAIKKEVSRQVANAVGPQGLPGTNGTNGLDGTARAYAAVDPQTCGGGGVCSASQSKGVSAVTRTNVGIYCVTAPGIAANSVAAAVTVDWSRSNGIEGNHTAFAGITCGANGFQVHTESQPSTPVRNSADTGPVSVAGNAVPSDQVGFTIVIP